MCECVSFNSSGAFPPPPLIFSCSPQPLYFHLNLPLNPISFLSFFPPLLISRFPKTSTPCFHAVVVCGCVCVCVCYAKLLKLGKKPPPPHNPGKQTHLITLSSLTFGI